MHEEKRFESKVKKYLTSLGAYVLKYWGGATTKSGVPDLIVCLNGIFLGVELKALKGRPSELQKYNVLRINEAGGISLILYPDGFEEFKKICEGVKRCNTHIAALSVIRHAHTSTTCNMSPSLKP